MACLSPGGVSTLCEKLAEGLEDSIKLESPVEADACRKRESSWGLRKGEREEVSAVISTAPVNVLAKTCKGLTALQEAVNFRYRPMVFVN